MNFLRKLTILVAAFTLAIGFAATSPRPTLAFTNTCLTVYEDGNLNGNNGTKCAYQNVSNMANWLLPSGQYCHGAWYPVEFNHWNNCVSSFVLELKAYKCFAAYDGTGYATRIYYKTTTFDTRVVIGDMVTEGGGGNDKWSSFRFGDIVNGTCYF